MMCQRRRRHRRVVLLWLVVPLLVVSGLACACTGAPAPETPPPREGAIPDDALKLSPDADPSPPILHVGAWRAPVPVPGEVNTAGAEDSPFVTPDGGTLYFFFTPDATVPPEQQLLDGVTGIYRAQREGDAWKQVERVILQRPGKLALDGCPTVAGDTLWFCSAREGYTGVNIFTAQRLESGWANVRYVGDLLVQEYNVGELHVVGDEIYYHAARPGGQGQYDIWVTRRLDGAWQPPENVAAVNSPEMDGWPYVSPDGQELWFTRMVQGSPAIYRSHRVADTWSEPELIVSQFAGEPSLDVEGNLYFVHHWIRDGIILDADLYVAYRQ
ncbi:MAG: hypothetical protein ACK2VD_11020 [Anaerolineae bacterium]